jgi:phospholipid/cholesterol/gamma-HCH transport system substrate-binding protein
VGSVSGIQAVQNAGDGTFHARLQLSLAGDVKLPANATAKVAQTSLLGSQHIALAAPAKGVGQLKDGSEIQLDQTGSYPTTEQTLSALGMVVNKGNLGALQDITDELYNAVANRTDKFVDLVPRLAELTASLDRQTDDIINAVDSLARFSGTLARNDGSLRRAIDSLPEALEVLNNNRTYIVDAFAALRNFATVGAHVLEETKDDFAEDMIDLFPVIKALNDNRGDFVSSLDLLPTFPFTTKFLRRAVRGDYLNVFVTFDLTLRRIGESVFTTSYFDPNMAHFNDVVNPPEWLIGDLANLSGQAADPFQIPPGTASGQGTP